MVESHHAKNEDQVWVEIFHNGVADWTKGISTAKRQGLLGPR